MDKEPSPSAVGSVAPDLDVSACNPRVWVSCMELRRWKRNSGRKNFSDNSNRFFHPRSYEYERSLEKSITLSAVLLTSGSSACVDSFNDKLSFRLHHLLFYYFFYCWSSFSLSLPLHSFASVLFYILLICSFRLCDDMFCASFCVYLYSWQWWDQ